MLINRFSDYFKEPKYLTKLGFSKRTEHTTSDVRNVWYERGFSRYGSDYAIVVRVVFELCISDDPFSTYVNNCTYYFSCVEMCPINLQEWGYDDIPFLWGDESEGKDEQCRLNKNIEDSMSGFRLDIRTLSQLRSFISKLGDA